MKYSSLLLAAALAAAAASSTFGQVPEDAAHPNGFLRKSTPEPSPGASAAPEPGKPLEAHLSDSQKGKATGTFPASTPTIYLVWADGMTTKGEKARASWVADDTGSGKSKNKKIYESSLTLAGPVGSATFSVGSPQGGFTPGKYHVELYEGSKLAKSLSFTVTK